MYVCSVKGFVKYLTVISLALLLGWASALFHAADVEKAFETVHETSSPYTLADSEAHSHPVQNFVAIVPAERVAGINQVRVPASPTAERVGSHTSFPEAQQCCCLLLSLREKAERLCYETYKARLCSLGHYLYSLCRMLI